MLNILRSLSRFMTWTAGAALIATALLVSLEVVLRRVFVVSLNVASELSTYVLAMVASWGFAYTLLARSHVRVDALVRLLPRRTAAWSDLAALAVLGLFVALLWWQSFGTLAESWRMGARAMTPLGTPMWIPQAVWVFGLSVFLLTICCLFAAAAALLAVGRDRDSRELIGTGSEEEDTLTEVREFLDDRRSAVP